MKTKKISDDTLSPEKILESIADRIGVKVVKWDTIDEAISKNISFGRVVDSTFSTTKEKRIIESKSKIW